MSDMSIYGSSAANRLRITGMATGLDVDTTVKQMLQGDQIKVDKAKQLEQYFMWKQEEYREIIKEMKEFQKYFKIGDEKCITSQTFNPISISYLKENIVTARATMGVVEGSYSIKVDQMAKGAEIKGNSLNAQYEIDKSDPVNWTDNWKGKIIDFSAGSITLNDPIEDLNKDGVGGDDIAAEINKQISTSDLKGKVIASYVKEGEEEYIKFTKTGSDSIKIIEDTTTVPDIKNSITGDDKEILNLSDSTKIFTKDGKFTLSYGTKDVIVEVTTNTTIKQLLDKIKTETSGNVTANFDEMTGSFSFVTKDTGSDVNLALKEDPDNGVLKALGLQITNASYGQDAKVEITAPGESTPTITTQKSNEFTANGVTYDIKSIGETSLTVDSDEQKVVDKIKGFVNDYNELIEKLQKKLTEKKPKVGEYKPLTDEQKEAMSEDDIKKWEAKGKEGILKNDDLLERMLSQLRGAFTSGVKDMSVYFGKHGDNALGLDMYSSYEKTGQIELDEDSLLKAIQNNSEDVQNFFFKDSELSVADTETYVGSGKYNEDGVFTRMKGIFENYVGKAGLGENGTFSLSGSMNIYVNKQYDFSISGSGGKNTISDQIYKQNIAMQNALKKMYSKEEKYYQQFSRLESAMNNLNSQSNWLSQQLGSM